MNDLQLIQQARKALSFAYAPYSGYSVAAALLTGDGRVYVGVNVENTSYGLTLCAERAAVAAAVSDGQRHMTALAVVSAKKPDPLPCGACRQVLAEFAANCRILVSGEGGDAVEYRLEDLFPRPFQFNGTKTPSKGVKMQEDMNNKCRAAKEKDSPALPVRDHHE